MKVKIVPIIVFTVFFVIAIVAYQKYTEYSALKSIDSYDSCVAAKGSMLQTTYPATCVTRLGTRFTQPIPSQTPISINDHTLVASPAANQEVVYRYEKYYFEFASSSEPTEKIDNNTLILNLGCSDIIVFPSSVGLNIAQTEKISISQLSDLVNLPQDSTYTMNYPNWNSGAGLKRFYQKKSPTFISNLNWSTFDVWDNFETPKGNNILTLVKRNQFVYTININQGAMCEGSETNNQILSTFKFTN